ncbi:MAG: undecaprenyldiphospho-muramoylpentapeptide beta-N-acetylglucosaminyltransferase [Bacteroidales bacterium]|nr:undecaprenyldiphospho-muramoylpentapeptide beta-N-acetylglucosaminyltransferase [Bacteroidales bacterium]
MTQQRHKKIIISGGGTGGHIFPAISIANALMAADASTEILFVGAEGRMEMEKVPAAGFRIIGLPVKGFSRKFTLENIKVLFKAIRCLILAKNIIKNFNPDAVAGVGGYASGPVLLRAAMMKIPTVIQEQNSYAGVTNRLLAKKASAICVAYDEMDKYFPGQKIVKTGNPVRQNFENIGSLKDEALDFFGLKRNRPVALVLGGSLGAGSINKCLSENIGKLTGSDCQWIWQTGSYYYEDIKKLVSGLPDGKISAHGFISRMDLAYAAADVIVSRAGAGTISELCLVGKPVILIPSPNVAEDHQTKNAKALADKNAAILMPDSMIAENLTDSIIDLLGNTAKRKELSENILKMAEKDADKRIAEVIFKLVQ